MNIMIVDDDPFIIDSLESFLSKCGHYIITAEKGKTALKKIKEFDKDFDLIITDIIMPEINGKELLQQIRAIIPDIDIILITGFSYSVNARSALELGASSFLKKPIRLEDLEHLVNQVEQQRKTRKKVGVLQVELKDEKQFREEHIKETMFARRLHQKIFPKDFAWCPNINFRVKHLPMAAVGGDFIDVKPYGAHLSLMMVADVSGHGIPAAFGGIALKTWFVALENGLNTSEIMQKANQTVNEIFPDEFYATAFCCLLNNETFEIQYCLAGHPSPFVISKDGVSICLSASGPALGLYEESLWEMKIETLGKNDVFIAFTDGLTSNPEKLRKALHNKLKNCFCISNEIKNLDKLIKCTLDTAVEVEPKRAFTDDLSLLVFTSASSFKIDNKFELDGKKIHIIGQKNEDVIQVHDIIIQLNMISKILYGNIHFCLKTIFNDKPDLVIFDLSDKAENDQIFIKEIHETFPNIPFVMIQKSGLESSLHTCLKNNMAGLITKPYFIDAIKQILVNAIQFDPESHIVSCESFSENWIDFLISSSPVTFTLLQQYIEALGRQPILQNDLDDVIYCIREIVGNAIEWGNKCNADLKVRISTVILSNKILIKITDEGKGFESHSFLNMNEKKDVETKLLEREHQGKRDGGFGLTIVKTMVDSIIYNTEGNMVLLTKNLDK